MTLNGEGSLAPGQHTLVLPTAPSLSRSLEPEFQGAPVVMRVVGVFTSLSKNFPYRVVFHE